MANAQPWHTWENDRSERILDMNDTFCYPAIIQVLVSQKLGAFDEYKKKIEFVGSFEKKIDLHEYIENKVCTNCKVRLECALLPGEKNFTRMDD